MAQSVIENANRYTNTTSSGAVHNGPGKLMGFRVNSFTAGATVKLWDNTAGSGAVITNTFTPLAAGYEPVPCKFATGLFVTITGTIDITIFSESA